MRAHEVATWVMVMVMVMVVVMVEVEVVVMVRVRVKVRPQAWCAHEVATIRWPVRSSLGCGFGSRRRLGFGSRA